MNDSTGHALMSEGDGYFQLQQLLTNLAMRVGQMEGTIKTFMENWATQDKLAHDARRVVYDRIELLSKQVERVSTDIHGVQQDLAELKKEIDEEVMPTIDATQIRGYKRAGAKGVWALLGGAIVMMASALAYIGDKIASYFVAKP